MHRPGRPQGVSGEACVGGFARRRKRDVHQDDLVILGELGSVLRQGARIGAHRGGAIAHFGQERTHSVALRAVAVDDKDILVRFDIDVRIIDVVFLYLTSYSLNKEQKLSHKQLQL